MSNIFYVYLHRRATDGVVFYVGKGSKIRAWSRFGRNRHWLFVVEKHGFEVEIYQQNMSEADAFQLEKRLIAQYGKENLCNYTDGGDGCAGISPSAETRALISSRHKGRIFGPETIEKMRVAALARPRERIERQAATLRGRKMPEDQKEKIRLAGMGRVTTEETRQKISQSKIGKKRDAATVEKMAASKRKPVFCVTNGKTYPSLTAASIELGVKQSHISNVMKGFAKQTKGYVFTEVKNAS